ncbi:MAG: hypothetical protein AB7E05_09745 [Sphingobium sp.]
MTFTEPLPLYHSWPLFEREEHLDLHGPDHGGLLTAGAALSARDGEELAQQGVGIWHCDLADNSLSWSAGVYDIFGLQRGAAVARQDVLPLYCEESRVVMEWLRAYAIKHKRGFTVDSEIRPALGRSRWMRLTAAPICEGRRVVGLQGIKRLVAGPA